MPNMPKFKFLRGLSANLPQALTDGAFYFTTDDGGLYVDTELKRYELNPKSDWEALTGRAEILHKPSIPTKVSQLENDSEFITEKTGATIVSATRPTVTGENDKGTVWFILTQDPQANS